jgi:hypothetical protein
MEGERLIAEVEESDALGLCLRGGEERILAWVAGYL